MRLLDKDPVTGVVTWFEHNSTTDVTTLAREQNVEPTIELATEVRNNPENWKRGVKKGMVKYATIPVVVLEEWIKQGVNINDTNELFRMINKPEYSRFRLTEKKHQ